MAYAVYLIWLESTLLIDILLIILINVDITIIFIF